MKKTNLIILILIILLGYYIYLQILNNNKYSSANVSNVVDTHLCISENNEWKNVDVIDRNLPIAICGKVISETYNDIYLDMALYSASNPREVLQEKMINVEHDGNFVIMIDDNLVDGKYICKIGYGRRFTIEYPFTITEDKVIFN